MASRKGHVEVVRMLLQHHADTSLCNVVCMLCGYCADNNLYIHLLHVTTFSTLSSSLHSLLQYGDTAMDGARAGGHNSTIVPLLQQYSQAH